MSIFSKIADLVDEGSAWAASVSAHLRWLLVAGAPLIGIPLMMLATVRGSVAAVRAVAAAADSVFLHVADVSGDAHASSMMASSNVGAWLHLIGAFFPFEWFASCLMVQGQIWLAVKGYKIVKSWIPTVN